MYTLFSVLGKLVDNLERWSNLIGTWLIVCLMLLITSNVAYRFLLGKSILGSHELAGLMMVGIVFFSIAYTQKQRRHIRMELVVSRLRSTTLHSFELAALLACLYISVLLFYRTLIEAIISINIRLITPGVIPWPAWPFKLVVAFGFLLLCLRISIQVIEQLRLLIAGR